MNEHHQHAIDSLESDIAELSHRVLLQAPVLPAVNLSHDDIGRLTAETVQASWNHTAQAVEAMGQEVKQRIANLEAALKECDDSLKLITEAADHIREKGKLVSADIEHTNAVCKDIRTTVADFKKKISIPAGS